MARLPKGLIPKSTNLPQIAIILIQAFIHGLNGKKKKTNEVRCPGLIKLLLHSAIFPSTLLVILLRHKLQGCRCSTHQLKSFCFFAALRDTLPKVELISTYCNCNSGGNKNVAPYFCGWVRYTGQFIMLLISQQNCKICCTKNCLE